MGCSYPGLFIVLFDHSNTLPEVAWKAIGNRTLIAGGYIRFTGYLTRSGQALREHWKSSPRQYPSVSAFIIIAHPCTHEHGESITTPKKQKKHGGAYVLPSCRSFTIPITSLFGILS